MKARATAYTPITDLKELRRITNVRIGGNLGNGATLLAEKHVPCEDTRLISIVLAVSKGFQPFTTWTRIRTIADQTYNDPVGRIIDYCEQGHYFRSLADALADFEERR